MIETLVTKEIALKLKDLKSNIRTVFYYENNILKQYTLSNDGWNFNQSFLNCFSVPTTEQVFDWLQKEHNIIVEIVVDKTMEPKYGFTINKYFESKNECYWSDENSEHLYRTSKETKIECINKILENELGRN